MYCVFSSSVSGTTLQYVSVPVLSPECRCRFFFPSVPGTLQLVYGYRYPYIIDYTSCVLVFIHPSFLPFFASLIISSFAFSRFSTALPVKNKVQLGIHMNPKTIIICSDILAGRGFSYREGSLRCTIYCVAVVAVQTCLFDELTTFGTLFGGALIKRGLTNRTLSA